MYDLLSIKLCLNPYKQGRIPKWQGRAAQALFYHTLEEIHPTISKTIHDLEQWYPKMPKPFTMSSLIGGSRIDDHIIIKPTHHLNLHMTTLHSQLTSIARNGVLSLWLGKDITLHRQQFHCTAVVEHTYLNYGDLLNCADDSDEVYLDVYLTNGL